MGRALAATLLLLPALLGLTGCENPRARPTGLADPVPATSVAIRYPHTNTMVPSDSTSPVVVEAQGAIQAVEILVKRAVWADTLAWDRVEFGELRDEVEVEFEVYIPRLETGVHLEIFGAAENLIGELHFSAPIYVQVIECDVYPIACMNL